MQDGVGFKIGRRGNIECHWSAGPGRCLILLFNWSQHADPATRSNSLFLYLKWAVWFLHVPCGSPLQQTLSSPLLQENIPHAHTHTRTHTHTQTHTQKPQFNSFGERVLWHQSWPDNHRETPSILTSTNSIYPFTTHPRPFDRVYLFDSESIPSQFRASSFWFAFFCLVWFFFFSNLLLAFLENCSIVLWHQPQPDNREGKIYIYIYIYSS